MQSARRWLYLWRIRKIEIGHKIERLFWGRSRKEEGFSITVCIPAYKSGDWIHETIESLERQTLQNFKVLISIDGGDSATYEKLHPYLHNPNYEIHLQKKRLGWVQNTNWLLNKVETPYLCILPHDDLFHPLYIEKLYRYLLSYPECLLVFSDTQMTGSTAAYKRRFFVQPSIKGSSFIRMEKYLRTHRNAAGFRGMLQQKAIRLAGVIPEGPLDNFAMDANWIGSIVRHGEIHRIGAPLCTKRYHTENTHSKWFEKPPEEIREAWKQSCRELLRVFYQDSLTSTEKQKLQVAASQRFQKGCAKFGVGIPTSAGFEMFL